MNDRLKDIIYISVPDSLEREINGFKIDPERLLPVESTSDAERYDIRDLTWEQILAGMLKILAFAPDHEDADYYRQFILAASPDIVMQLTETAVITTRNGSLDLAEEIFLALHGLQPNDPATAVNLALLYEQRAKQAADREDDNAREQAVETAFRYYEQALSSDDVPAEAHLNAGFFYAQEQRYSAARRELSSYVELSEDEERVNEAKKMLAHIDAHNLADTQFSEAYQLIQTGKELEGIELVRAFLRTNPDVWNAWFLLGWGLRRLGRYEEAADAFLHALEHGPRQADTLNELAICSMEIGEHEKANKLLVEALASEPENTKIISNLGIVSMKLDRSSEAAAYFRIVLELNPEDVVAKAYLDQL
ncbi:MAG: tetratricopeptide repeat protein [Spirochaetales bacterium]